jgi:hypothetical protein
MTDIHYLVVYQPGSERVPVSVFFAGDPAGTVRGLYFGDAGSGTSDEAYFRMEVSPRGVERFLECDSAEDPAFRVDRARDGRGRLPSLSATDAQVFARLCSYRQTWWTFEEDDYVQMDATRVEAMQWVDGMRFAQSPGIDPAGLGLIRQFWSLHGF